jgi:hypothetical protein
MVRHIKKGTKPIFKVAVSTGRFLAFIPSAKFDIRLLAARTNEDKGKV